MPAEILNGAWTRKVTWEQNGMWRTDIFKTTLAASPLQEAEFVLKDGRRVIIPAEELRRVLVGSRDLRRTDLGTVQHRPRTSHRGWSAGSDGGHCLITQ